MQTFKKERFLCLRSVHADNKDIARTQLHTDTCENTHTRRRIIVSCVLWWLDLWTSHEVHTVIGRQVLASVINLDLLS